MARFGAVSQSEIDDRLKLYRTLSKRDLREEYVNNIINYNLVNPSLPQEYKDDYKKLNVDTINRVLRENPAATLIQRKERRRQLNKRKKAVNTIENNPKLMEFLYRPGGGMYNKGLERWNSRNSFGKRKFHLNLKQLKQDLKKLK